jgi:hypothetical protein
MLRKILLFLENFLALCRACIKSENMIRYINQNTAQLLLYPQQAVFENPEESKHQHLEASCESGIKSKKPMDELPFDEDDTMKDFGGNTLETERVSDEGLTIGSQTISATLFVVDSVLDNMKDMSGNWERDLCQPASCKKSIWGMTTSQGRPNI